MGINNIINNQSEQIKVLSSVITSSGQATIPKEVRKHLGIEPGGRIYFYFNHDKITVGREATDDEFLAQLDALKSPKSIAKEKEVGKKYANTSVTEMLRDWEKSPKGKAYLKEAYGLN